MSVLYYVPIHGVLITYACIRRYLFGLVTLMHGCEQDEVENP